MQKTINHLVQLQDLAIARAQQEASMPGTCLTQLAGAIATLLKELPPDLRTQFSKLERKSHIAIAPISTNNVCTGCGMTLPASLVQAVRLAEKIHQCSHCARMLYFSESLPRRTVKPSRRSEPPKVGIERFSSLELMIPKLSATTLNDVITELCEKMEAEGFVENSDRLIEEALKREAIVSTAVGHGLAFPHVRGVEGGGLSLALGLSKKGIKFGGPSKTLTRIIFFMVIPTAASAFYLKLLSGLTETFRSADMRNKLLEAKDAKTLWKTLLKVTRSTIS